MVKITLKEKYSDCFKIGACVNSRSIATHKELILSEFNSVTCENEMKFAVVCPDGENYDFTRADAIHRFAVDNGLDLRFHTFLWHNQTPPQIFEGATRDRLIASLKKHIDIMAARYGKSVYTCDVANEVIEDKQDSFFRSSPWFEIIGEDFCDIAFSYAKQAMPNVKLCYNDYNESNPVKSKKIFDFVKGMKDRGVPVDTLGLQAHWNIFSPSLDDIRRAFDLYSKLGVNLQVTEMDVSVFAFEDASSIASPTAEMLEKQADLYEKVFGIFREYSEIIDCVTTWGVADDDTWLDRFPFKDRKNWPLLFGINHGRKEAWSRIMNF